MAVKFPSPVVGQNPGWFNVKDYLAVGDGSNDDTAEINAAISAANAAGGGTVWVPPGTYLISSTLDLLGKVTLHLEPGAELTSVTDHDMIWIRPDCRVVGGGSIRNTNATYSKALLYVDPDTDGVSYYDRTDLPTGASGVSLYGPWEGSSNWDITDWYGSAGIRLRIQATAIPGAYIQWTLFEDITIGGVQYGVHLDKQDGGNGWANGNTFRDIRTEWIHQAVKIYTALDLTGASCNSNIFDSFVLQVLGTQEDQECAIWNEGGIGNRFTNWTVFDWTYPAIAMYFSGTATKNFVESNIPHNAIHDATAGGNKFVFLRQHTTEPTWSAGPAHHPLTGLQEGSPGALADNIAAYAEEQGWTVTKISGPNTVGDLYDCFRPQARNVAAFSHTESLFDGTAAPLVIEIKPREVIPSFYALGIDWKWGANSWQTDVWISYYDTGITLGGAGSTVILSSSDPASGVVDKYNTPPSGFNTYYIEIKTGPAAGDIRKIIDCDGSTNPVITVDSAWSASPGTAAEYVIWRTLTDDAHLAGSLRHGSNFHIEGKPGYTVGIVRIRLSLQKHWNSTYSYKRGALVDHREMPYTQGVSWWNMWMARNDNVGSMPSPSNPDWLAVAGTVSTVLGINRIYILGEYYDNTRTQFMDRMALGVFNVKDFGAKGDGSTDDLPAINAALAAAKNTGSPVYFPPGKYRITDTLWVRAGENHLYFAGAGEDVANPPTNNGLYFDPAAGSKPAVYIDRQGPSRYSTFRNINVTHASPATYTGCTGFQFSDDALLDDLVTPDPNAADAFRVKAYDLTATNFETGFRFGVGDSNTNLDEGRYYGLKTYRCGVPFVFDCQGGSDNNLFENLFFEGRHTDAVAGYAGTTRKIHLKLAGTNNVIRHLFVNAKDTTNDGRVIEINDGDWKIEDVDMEGYESTNTVQMFQITSSIDRGQITLDNWKVPLSSTAPSFRNSTGYSGTINNSGGAGTGPAVLITNCVFDGKVNCLSPVTFINCVFPRISSVEYGPVIQSRGVTQIGTRYKDPATNLSDNYTYDFVPGHVGGVFNVKDFGAKGDGTTDDTAAINACFAAASNAGVAAYLPAGTYKITDTLWAVPHGSTYQSCHVFGHGKGYGPGSVTMKTIIDATAVKEKPAIAVYASRTVRFEGFSIHGPNTQPRVNFEAQGQVFKNFGWGGVTGTAQSGGASTIQLASADTSMDDVYNLWHIKITGGTGSGQERVVTDYVRSTKTATVNTSWATQPDATSTYSLTPWLTPNVRDSRYSPQCAIGITIGRGATPTDGGYSGVTYSGSSGGSHGIHIDNVTFADHVVGVLVGPDNSSNDDLGIITNCEFKWCKEIVSVCHAQAREWVLDGCNLGGARSVASTKVYGARDGCMPKIINSQVGLCYELFNGGSPSSQVVCRDTECETVHRIGYIAGASANHPVILDGVRWKWINPDSQDRGPGHLLMASICNIRFSGCLISRDGSATNLSNAVIIGNGGNSIVFDSCKFNVADTTKPLHLHGNLLEAGSFAVTDSYVWSATGTNTDARFLGLTGIWGNQQWPTQRFWNDSMTPIVTDWTGKTYKYVRGCANTNLGPYVGINQTSFAKGASTATFNSTNSNLLVGDYLTIRCWLPQSEGLAYDNGNLRVVGLKITVITPGSPNAITCQYMVDPSLIMETQTDMYLYRGEWAPIGTLTGNTTVSVGTITGISPNTNGLRVGDFIQGTGLAANTRILSVDSSSQVTITPVAASSQTGTNLYWGQLVEL